MSGSWRRACTCLPNELLARGVLDEDVLGEALLIGPVARVYQDARVHDGHPPLLLPVQLLNEPLQRHSTRNCLATDTAHEQATFAHIEAAGMAEAPSTLR